MSAFVRHFERSSARSEWQQSALRVGAGLQTHQISRLRRRSALSRTADLGFDAANGRNEPFVTNAAAAEYRQYGRRLQFSAYAKAPVQFLQTGHSAKKSRNLLVNDW